MKKQSVIFFLLAVCFPAFLHAEDLREENFENGLGSWKPRFGERDADVKIVSDPDNEENQVCRLFLDPTDLPEPTRKEQTIYIAQGPIAVGGGNEVQLSAKCRIEGSSVSAGFYVFFVDQETNEKQTAPIDDEGRLQGDTTDQGKWETIKQQVVVPDGFTQMYVQLSLKGEDGTAWFDEVEIKIEYP